MTLALLVLLALLPDTSYYQAKGKQGMAPG